MISAWWCVCVFRWCCWDLGIVSYCFFSKRRRTVQWRSTFAGLVYCSNFYFGKYIDKKTNSTLSTNERISKKKKKISSEYRCGSTIKDNKLEYRKYTLGKGKLEVEESGWGFVERSSYVV